MGIIQRQAVKTTSVIFAGLAIGIVSRLLMPFLLSKEQIGALALVDSVSNLFAAIFSLGFVQLAFRMFERFRNEENGHNGFLLLGLIISSIGATIGVLIYLFFKPWILGDEGQVEPLAGIASLIGIVIVFKLLFRNLDMYVRLLHSSVIGAFMESFVMKAVILVSLCLYWAGILAFTSLSYLYILALILPGLVITIVAIRKTKVRTWPNAKLQDKAHRKEMVRTSAFGLMMSAAGILVLTIDQLMMIKLLPNALDDVGVYSVLFFAGMIVNVPSRGIKRIASTILSKAWEKGDMDEIRAVYQKSSLSNLLTGIYLLAVGWLCLDDVLTFLPDYQYAIYVFLFIGIGQLIEMATGVNQEIIAASNRFEFNTYNTLILGGLVVLFNYLLIPNYGVNGAALASLGAVGIINIIRIGLVYHFYKLQPFTGATLKAFLLGSGMLFLAYTDPLKFDPLINIVCYVLGVSIVYWGLVYTTGISPDISKFINKLVRRISP